MLRTLIRTKAGYARIDNATKKFSGGAASPVIVADSACFVVFFVMGSCIPRPPTQNLPTYNLLGNRQT